MAILDEEIVEHWLNQNGFFTMRGVKCGVDEIDLLAIKYSGEELICWHVEVQVSFRPVGYIGGDTNARRRSVDELTEGVNQWVEKKFKAKRKLEKRNSIVPGVDWKYVFVCAVLKDDRELDLINDLGVEIVRYDKVLKEVISSKEHQTSSVANNIVEILRYYGGR